MYRALPLILLLATSCRCSDPEGKKTSETKTPAEPGASSAPQAAESDPVRAVAGNARFRVEGEWEAATTDATAIAWMSGEVLRKIELRTTQAFRRKEKQTFDVQLRFPTSFQPKVGAYEIARDHMRRDDAVGATLVAHTDYITTLAADPTGELTLTSVSPTRIAGKFRVEVWDKAGHEKHQRVRSATVVGNFTAVRQASRAQ